MPVDAAQVAERTRKLAMLRGKKVPSEPVKVERRQAQIDPEIVYLKSELFAMLRVGEVTWKKWKSKGLSPFRCGKSLAVRGSALIAVMETQD